MLGVGGEATPRSQYPSSNPYAMDLPLFPLNSVLFPGASLPLHVFEERYRVMIARCLERQQPFGVVLIRSGQEVGGPAEPFEVGTTARIARAERFDDGRYAIVAVGVQRFHIEYLSHDQPYLSGSVALLENEDEDSPDVAEEAARAGELYTQYTRLKLALTNEWTRTVALPKRPGALADYVAARIDVDQRIKQRLLEELSVPRRLADEQHLLARLLDLLDGQVQEARRLRLSAFGAMN